MIIFRYIAMIVLSVYATALIVGELNIALIALCLSISVFVVLWLMYRSSMIQKKYEFIFILMYIIGNVYLVIISDLSGTLKIAFSVGISVILAIDVITYYTMVVRSQ